MSVRKMRPLPKPYCVMTGTAIIACFRSRGNAKRKCRALERRGVRCTVTKSYEVV